MNKRYCALGLSCEMGRQKMVLHGILRRKNPHKQQNSPDSTGTGAVYGLTAEIYIIRLLH
jgi:hypothetical protein